MSDEMLDIAMKQDHHHLDVGKSFFGKKMKLVKF
jgi:hypothetical protein